uniref:hypothetical protein n=1 Tax=Enterococcus faecium TaxID=1352 RepID=UPI00292FD5BE
MILTIFFNCFKSFIISCLGSAVLAIIFLHRGNKKEEQISIPAMISCYLGVTEPAMFGINL